ncbi:MAG: pyruvate kinase [Planctomycetota bacterium]
MRAREESPCTSAPASSLTSPAVARRRSWPPSAPRPGARTCRRLFAAGVNVFRLNFSHGDHATHTETLERIRKVEAEFDRPVAVLQDLCGPKIRTSKLPGGEIALHAGDQVRLVAGLDESHDPAVIGISLPRLADDATEGDRVLIDDGLIELRVLGRVGGDSLSCEVVHGGLLRERKGVNLPDTGLSLTSFTEKDRNDLAWGIEHEVDFVAMSFVRHENDVRPLRELTAHMKNPPKLIAKIERPEAVERLREIVLAFDAVMVARGDLSVELPLYEVPVIQKRIIRLAALLDKPVITATQMLDSMQENPRPTRAEASDVANAIFDGTDAVMLSGETATGNYPEQAVRVMSQIAAYADSDTNQPEYNPLPSEVDQTSFADAMCGGAIRVAEHLNARCLVCFTKTGRTARFMSKWQPKIPVFGVSDEMSALRRMCLYRGINPILVASSERSEELVAQAEAEIIRRGWARQGELAIYVGGSNLTAKGNINSLKARRVGEAGGL